MDLQKLLKIVAIVIGVISIFFLGSIISTGDEAIKAGDASGTIDIFMNVSYVILAIAVLNVLVFSVLNLVSNTAGLKNRFIEGGPGFMGIVLLCLILRLAIAIERIIFLNLSTTNSKKLIDEVEGALASGGLDAAKEVCRNTKGPIASIFYQGLDRANEDLDSAEKAVVAYGGVQMGQLEKNVSWISLFIALAPMLGFMGTVIGMIQAFDKIEAAGDMQPSLVAGGIKVALLTTVFGLIVAIILQVFYNYIIAKIDSIVNDMEDSSISLMDILVKNKK
jgi:biopolymer transport protein ExbB